METNTDGRSDTHKGNNPIKTAFLKTWNGEYSLPWHYWVINGLFGIPVGIAVQIAPEYFFLPCLAWVVVTTVGLWRSAAKRKGFWGYLVLGIISLWLVAFAIAFAAFMTVLTGA